jgi:hypothetical protein
MKGLINYGILILVGGLWYFRFIYVIFSTLPLQVYFLSCSLIIALDMVYVSSEIQVGRSFVVF